MNGTGDRAADVVSTDGADAVCCNARGGLARRDCQSHESRWHPAAPAALRSRAIRSRKATRASSVTTSGWRSRDQPHDPTADQNVVVITFVNGVDVLVAAEDLERLLQFEEGGDI